MSQPVHVKATHKAIQTSYQTLKDYREHGVGHETALRSAFQNLLAEIAKTRHWLLAPEQSNRSSGKRVVPDGTLFDQNNLHIGYWEAKGKCSRIEGYKPIDRDQRVHQDYWFESVDSCTHFYSFRRQHFGEDDSVPYGKSLLFSDAKSVQYSASSDTQKTMRHARMATL